jgi:sterol 3beta-glucosyltransferase
MKTIAVLATGSRGDVQPFLALAVGLLRRGHAVKFVSNSIHGDLARAYGLETRRLTWDPRPSMRLQVTLAKEKNPFRYIRGQMENTRLVYSLAQQESFQACQDADALIFSVLSPWGYSIAERSGIPCMAGMIHPLERTHEFPMQMIPANLGGGLNWLSHLLAEQLFQLLSGGEINKFRRKLGLPVQRFPSTLFGSLRERDIPLLCNLSPTVTVRPRDWPERIHMHGYWFLPVPPGWTPPPGLTAFLTDGEPPVYIGFGSMVTGEPLLTSRMFDEALAAVGLRGLLYEGWGGLTEAGFRKGRILTVGEMPHDWLFEQVSAVIHHGGAGTTASALRAGIPQVVVAHMQDQPYWGRKMHAIGVSPPPLNSARICAEAIEKALRTIREDKTMQECARGIGTRIRAEQGLEKTLVVIETYLDL